MTESEILHQLSSVLRSSDLRAVLEPAVAKVEKELQQHPQDLFGWTVIPLHAFPEELPKDVGSCWIFVIRAGIPPEKHRHPNSRQRTFSYRGSGDLQVFENERWVSNVLVEQAALPFSQVSCVSVPPGAWHRPVVEQDWVVVSFHTAAAEDVREESGEDELKTRSYTR